MHLHIRVTKLCSRPPSDQHAYGTTEALLKPQQLAGKWAAYSTACVAALTWGHGACNSTKECAAAAGWRALMTHALCRHSCKGMAYVSNERGGEASTDQEEWCTLSMRGGEVILSTTPDACCAVQPLATPPSSPSPDNHAHDISNKQMSPLLCAARLRRFPTSRFPLLAPCQLPHTFPPAFTRMSRHDFGTRAFHPTMLGAAPPEPLLTLSHASLKVINARAHTNACTHARTHTPLSDTSPPLPALWPAHPPSAPVRPRRLPGLCAHSRRSVGRVR